MEIKEFYEKKKLYCKLHSESGGCITRSKHLCPLEPLCAPQCTTNEKDIAEATSYLESFDFSSLFDGCLPQG